MHEIHPADHDIIQLEHLSRCTQNETTLSGPKCGSNGDSGLTLEVTKSHSMDRLIDSTRL